LKAERPIIIKRIVKKSIHASHGGAWKIAYADFVTAMMAFFLIMWLINSVSVEQKKGIADYFASSFTRVKTQPKADGVIPNNFSIKAGSTPDISSTEETKEDPEDKQNQKKKREDSTLTEAQNKLVKSLESNIALKAIVAHVAFRMSDDGLDINVADKEGRSLFPPGSIELYDYMRSVIKEIAKTLLLTKNKIGICGHTDAIPYANTKNYTNWELSADRANAIRRALESEGVPSERIDFVKGRSSNELVNKDNPAAPENRRITITILR
jgi:chemotaxis protein MotB